jgi:plastocyanin
MKTARPLICLLAASLIIGIVLAVGGCGGGGTDEEIVIGVQMKADDTFAPRGSVGAPGTRVRWTNEDTQHHAVIADPGNPIAGGPNSDAKFPVGLAAGDSFEWRIPLGTPAGTVFYYHCRFKGAAGTGTAFGTGMVGKITVN